MTTHEMANFLLTKPDMSCQAFAVVNGKGQRFDLTQLCSSEKYEGTGKVCVIDLIEAKAI